MFRQFTLQPAPTMSAKVKSVSLCTRVRTLRILSVALWALVALGFLLVGAMDVVGQQKAYDQDKIASTLDENAPGKDPKKARAFVKSLTTECRDYLRGEGTVTDRNFNGYFNNYVFPKMTHFDDESVGKLGESRTEFFKQFMSRDVSGARRNRIIGLTATYMKNILASKKNYHPAVRLNAILVLGTIDSTPSPDSSTLPRPYAPAMDVLTKVLADANSPDYLKVGAMAGIQRHLEIGQAGGNVPQGLKDSIRAASIGILNAPVDNDAKYWLCRRSAQCLGVMADAGPGGEAINALRKTLKDDTNSMWLRFDALNALAQMKIGAANKDNVAGISYEISQFVGQSMDFEANQLNGKVSHLIIENRLQSNVDLIEKGSGKSSKDDNKQGAVGIGTVGDGSGTDKKKDEDEKEPKVEVATYHLNIARRRAKLIANAAKEAFERKDGIATVVNADEQAFIKKMVSILSDAIVDVNTGIVRLDLKDDEEAEENENGDTEAMIEALAGISKDINEALPESKRAAPKADAKVEVKADAEPAGEGDAAPSGDAAPGDEPTGDN